MKNLALLLMFFLISFGSISQNQRILNVKNNPSVSLSQTKDFKPVKLALSGNESLCEVNESVQNQLKKQDITIAKKEQENLTAYIYNVVNPTLGDDFSGNEQRKAFRIRIRIRFKKYVDKDGYTHIELDLCVGKGC